MTSPEATGQKVQPPQIDYYVTGAITSIELSKEGGALGGGFIPVVGLVSKNTEKATLALDVSLLNPQTLEVETSKAFKADSSESSWGLAGMGGGAGYGAGGGWSVSKSLSLDPVTRQVVFETANFLAEKLASAKIVSRPAPAEKK